MPRRDGSGPLGMGPMTGRAAGYCAGNVTSGVTNFFPGRRLGRLGSEILRGRGRGRGLGLGLGCFLIQHILTQTDERDHVLSLEQQATQLENKLQAVRKEIAEAKARKEVD